MHQQQYNCKLYRKSALMARLSFWEYYSIESLCFSFVCSSVSDLLSQEVIEEDLPKAVTLLDTLTQQVCNKVIS